MHSIVLNKIRKNNSGSKQAKSESGFLSLEMGLVLLVIALAIVAAVLYYRDNLRKTSTNNTTQQILTTSANLRAKYGQTNSYGTVTTAMAVRSGSIPEALRDGTAASATNTYGGAITIAPASLNGANDSLQVSWPNVPNTQCSDVVTNIEREMRQVSVGSTVVKPNNGAIDLSALETACDAASGVTINFWVGRS